MCLVTHLLSVVVQSLLDLCVKELACNDNDNNKKNKLDVFLCVWQNLVWTQAKVVCCVSYLLPVVAQFWEAACTVAQNGLERLQRILPVLKSMIPCLYQGLALRAQH